MAISFASIPEIQGNIQADLLRLAEHAETILRILEETKSQRPSTSALAFARLIAKSLSISTSEAGRLLNAFQNLLLLDQEAGDHDKTLELIADRFPSDVREKWDNKKPVIRSILVLLAADHPAVISFKAQRLSFSYERVFMEAEIFTDARPVYTIAGDKILEMIIQHKLVITQHDSSHRNTDIHLVMDARDLVNLKKACDRAMQKAKVLKDSLGNMPWVTEILSEDEQT